MKFDAFLQGFKELKNFCLSHKSEPLVVAYDEAGNKFDVLRVWVDGNEDFMFVVRNTGTVATPETMASISAGEDD